MIIGMERNRSKTVEEDASYIRNLRSSLEELRRRSITDPSLGLENEISRLEWLLAKTTSTLN